MNYININTKTDRISIMIYNDILNNNMDLEIIFEDQEGIKSNPIKLKYILENLIMIQNSNLTKIIMPSIDAIYNKNKIMLLMSLDDYINQYINDNKSINIVKIIFPKLKLNDECINNIFEIYIDKYTLIDNFFQKNRNTYKFTLF
jgi:hypothetical protein